MGNAGLSGAATTSSNAPPAKDATVGVLGLGPAGRSAYACFLQAGYHVLGWDQDPEPWRNYGSYDLRDVMKSDVLVPTSDAMLAWIAEGGLYGLKWNELDKRLPYSPRMLQRLAGRGKRLSASMYTEVGKGGEIPEDSPVLLTPPPWLLRLEGAAGGSGQFFITRRKEAKQAIRLWENAHGPTTGRWQLCPDLRDYPNIAVDLLLDRDSRPVYSFVRQRLSTLDAGQRTSGLSSSARMAMIPLDRDRRNRIRDRAVEIVTGELPDGLACGPFGVDFKWPYLTEVNAGRFNTSAWDWSLRGDGLWGRGRLAQKYAEVTLGRGDVPAITETDVARSGSILWRDPGWDAKLMVRL